MNPQRPILTATVISMLMLSEVAAAQSPPEIFAKANQEFAAGHFREAVDGYEAVIRAGNINTAVFYDLGNAWFRSGDFGRAILSYERVLALDPHHPEAGANLRLVRDEARALEVPKTAPERYLGIATTNQYVIFAAITFWLSIFMAAQLFFSRRSRFGGMTFLAFVLTAFAVAAFAIYTRETGNQGIGLAIVIERNTQARVATADNSKSVLELPPGSEIKILSRRGDWIYAALPNDLRGWIPAKAAETVRM